MIWKRQGVPEALVNVTVSSFLPFQTPFTRMDGTRATSQQHHQCPLRLLSPASAYSPSEYLETAHP